MSLSSNSIAANDPDLQARVQAQVFDQAFNNVGFADTLFTQQVRSGYANLTSMYFAVAVAVGASYEAGLLNGRGSPGHDVDVITDGQILAAVQANWPTDEVPTSPTP